MFRVLIADDEIRICNLIKKLVDWDAMDLEIIAVVHNGRDALRVTYEQKPDIIVADIRMPEYDGISLISKIKEDYPEISFIIISGYREFEYARSALQFGAEDYLLKPIKKLELTNALNRIITRKSENIQAQDELCQRERRMRNNSCKLRSVFVQDLLQKEKLSGYTQIEDINRDYECGFVTNCFTVAAIKIDLKKKLDSASFERFVSTCVYGIIERHLVEEGLVNCSAAVKGVFYVVVNCGDADREKLKTSLHHTILSLKDLSSQNHITRVTIGLGLSANSVADAKKSAEQAHTMVMDRILCKGDRILEYKKERSAWSIINYIDHVTRKRILDLLSTLQRDKLNDVFEGIGDRLQKEAGQIGGEAVYLVYRELTMILMSRCGEFFPDMQLDKLFQSSLYRLDTCDSFSAFSGYIKGLTKSIFSEIEESQRICEKRPFLNAKRYIHQHFSENLTLEQVSAFAGFNPAYFSSAFKKETGQSFLKYLTEIRIQKAKELLADPSRTVSQIATEVGYSDEKYFFRIFKKNVDLTTREYRKLYCSERER